mgnify:CR=1 FL=1
MCSSDLVLMVAQIMHMRPPRIFDLRKQHRRVVVGGAKEPYAELGGSPDVLFDGGVGMARVDRVRMCVAAYVKHERPPRL